MFFFQQWVTTSEEVMSEYVTLTHDFVTRNDVTEWEKWINNVETFPIDDVITDDRERSEIISQRKTLLKIHELSLLNQSLKTSDSGDHEMAERLEMLSQRHRDVIERIQIDDDVIRRRIELWNHFKADQQRLKDWIREMESEKMILNLKHLQLDSITETINVIQVTNTQMIF
jgi:hypothetical protein